MSNVTANLTPKYIARTILAGARERIGAYGRYITVVAIAPSTISISIQDDNEQVLVNGMQIDCEDRRYDHFILHNTGGAPSTVILYLSETLVVDLRQGALIGAIAASLASIDVDTDELALIHAHIHTVVAGIANIDASTAAAAIDLAALEILITAGNVDLAALEVLVTAGNVDLAALEVLVTAGNVDLAGVHTAIDAATTAVSTDGGAGQIALGAGGDGAGPNQAMREIMFHTAAAQVYCTIDDALGNADNADYLLVADVPYTIPVANGQIVRFHNQDAGAAATVYYIWRN